ncbi:MAG TPA: TIGR03067 domain-containing protein [Urbifossiella sp.]
MRCLAFPAILLALATSFAADSPLEFLEGTYKAAALTRDGQEESAAVVNSISAKIAADELTFTIKDKTFPAKIKVNAKANPAAIDIAPTDGPEKGKTFLGIYKMEKGELLIAFAERGDRPTAFKGEEGVLLIRLKKNEKK